MIKGNVRGGNNIAYAQEKCLKMETPLQGAQRKIKLHFNSIV